MDESDIPLLERPYSERQLIVVGANATAHLEKGPAAIPLPRDPLSTLANDLADARGHGLRSSKGIIKVGQALTSFAISSMYMKHVATGMTIVSSLFQENDRLNKFLSSTKDDRTILKI